MNDSNQGTPEPMTCEDARDLLHALIQNDLEDEDSAMVLQHLAGCKACRAALAEHVKLNGLLQANMPWLGKIYFNRSWHPVN